MIQVPLANNGQAGLLNTGIRVPAVAQNVTAGPAVGQGLMHLGALGSDMAFQMRRANDTTGLVQAEGIMKQHAAEQQLFQQKNPDQNTWGQAWQDRYATVQDQLGKIPLSNSARASLNQTLNFWHQRMGTEIEGQAYQQSIGRANQAVTNLATEQALAGNPEGVEQAWKLHPPGMAPEELEAMKLKLMGQARDVRRGNIKNNVQAALLNNQPEVARSWLDKGAQVGAITQEEHAAQMADINHSQEVQNLVTIANDDPRRAMELAFVGEQAKRISGPERVRIVEAAQGKLDNLRADAVKDYTSQIKLGVADKNAFADKILKDSNLEPVDRANLSRFLDVGPVNDPISYASIYAEAKAFEGKEGSPEYSRLLSRIDMALDGEQKSSATAALADAVKAPKDAQHRSINEVYSMAAGDLKNGMFGDINSTLDSPGAVLPKNIRDEVATIRGSLMMGKVSPEDQAKPEVMAQYERAAREQWWKNQPEKARGKNFNAYVIEDETKKAQAFRRYQDAVSSLEKWQSAHPEATAADLRSEYEKYLVRQRAAGGVSASPLLPALDTPKIDLQAILQRHATNSRK